MKKFGLSGILNYLLSVALAVVFALFLSGRVGWFLVSVLVLSPVASVIATLALSRFVEIESGLEECTVNKGDIVNMPITVENRTILPLPPIVLEIEENPSVSCKENLIVVSVLSLGREKFEIYFNANIAGKSKIGVGKVYIADYFGFIRFKLRRISCEALSTRVCVIPDIADISTENEIISNIIETAAHSLDSEDTTEKGQHSFVGFPGYDSREYVPGDPLKRINWKLSAKRNTLLIRLDDEVLSSQVSVVLDSMLAIADEKSESKESLMLAQKTMENSLGIARSLYLNGCTVNYFVKSEDGWERYTISSEEDMIDISLILASYSFGTDEPDRIPYEYIVSDKGSTVVLCTPRRDRSVELLEAQCAEKGMASVIYFAEERGGEQYGE